jgi:hypothetical protein
MSSYAVSVPRRRRIGLRRLRARAEWPVYVLFLGIPAWWLLGVSHFMWPVIAGVMALSLLQRTEVKIPGTVALWALFLAWFLASGVGVDTSGRAFGFALRFSFYASAGIFLLWLFNKPRITSRAIVQALAGYWVLVVIGGYLGVLFPTLEFHTPIEHFIPGGLLANDYIHDMTHARFAEVQTFLGYPIGRPTTFFTYTNGWGSGFGLLLPFAIAAVAITPRGVWRRILVVALVASIVPAIVSLNRGLWISLLVAGTYVTLRFVAARHPGRALRLIMAGGLIAVLITVSPLGSLIDQRLEHGQSNQARGALYQETFSRVSSSPLVGYGSPRPAEGSSYLDSVGTQGQVLYLVFSHGYPGLLLFFGWLGHAFLTSRRPASPGELAGHVALLIAAVQAPFYGLLMQMFVIVAAAVVALRPHYGWAEERSRAA